MDDTHQQENKLFPLKPVWSQDATKHFKYIKLQDHAKLWFLILSSTINFSVDFDCHFMSLTKVNRTDSTTVKGHDYFSSMSRLHILLNKYLSNTPPLKSLEKIPLKQHSGTFDTWSMGFRELFIFKSFCLGILLRGFFDSTT